MAVSFFMYTVELQGVICHRGGIEATLVYSIAQVILQLSSLKMTVHCIPCVMLQL